MHALEVCDFHKVYAHEAGSKTALDGVSLNVPKGSFYALLGPNGAGKSTLINILADIVRPTSGSARLFGRDLFAERAWCKRHMGVVPQEIAFDPFFTPREVLHFTAGLFGVHADDDWVDELFSRLELAEHAHKNTRQLSGGMRRRLLVAQALVHKPELVILDEPTAGVDVELRRRLWRFMRELNQRGTTILLTTHYLEEAEELCDRVAIIDRGKLLTERPMRELMREVASSHLWLQYEDKIRIREADREALAEFEPRETEQGVCLRLSGSGSGSRFHAAYQAAVERFGPPLDAQVRSEDLEDVFLRLTGRQTSGEGCA